MQHQAHSIHKNYTLRAPKTKEQGNKNHSMSSWRQMKKKAVNC